jgi:glucose-1-phosphate thymidylyltransferase
MQMIIPMAGYGKRLRPHTFSRPKPLINVAGQPMLKFILDALSQIKIDEYIFIVGYLGDQIEEYVRKHTNINARFVVQEEMIGQSHAVYLARDHINGPGMILFTDTLFETDLSIIEKTDADGIFFTKEVEDPSRFGVVVQDGSGRITHFIEKPETKEHKQALIGFYYIRDTTALLKSIEKQIADEKQMLKGEYFLAGAFQNMIDEGKVFKPQTVDVWLDCGTEKTVLETNRYLLDHGRDTSGSLTARNVAVIPPVYVHPSAIVENAVIGPHATISENCVIRDSMIRDSIIDTGAHVTDIQVSGTLIGQGAKVYGHWHRLNVGDASTMNDKESEE